MNSILSHDSTLHIDAVPNRSSGPAYLLCESCRVGNRVRKRTLANLSALSDEQIEAMRAVLAGVAVRPVEELFQVVRFTIRSIHHDPGRIGCAPTSCCACSPTMSSGTCAKPGVSYFSRTKISKPNSTATR